MILTRHSARRGGLLFGWLTAALVLAGQEAAGQDGPEIRIAPGQGAPPMIMRDAIQAQRAAAPAGTATVSGIVVSSDLRRPVRRATVRLASTTPSMPLTATSDDQGRFTFENVGTGQFTLTASKPGYLDSTYGERRPGSGRPGTPLSIADGQKIDRLTLPIARGGVLAGTVVDDGGEPAYGTEVRALRYVWQEGERTLRLAGSTRADDRGSYRLAALPPGQYIVMATPAGDAGLLDEFGTFAPKVAAAGQVAFGVGRPIQTQGPAAAAPPTTGYAPVYYPGTTSSGIATPVTIDVSEERSGLDLQMQLLPMGRINGVVTNDDGRPAAGSEVRLISLDQPLPGIGVRTTGTGPDGRFSFSDVTPGRYRLRAHVGLRQQVVVDQSGGETRVMMQFFSTAKSEGAGQALPGTGFAADQAGQQRWAASDVTVMGPNIETVSMALQPGNTVTGRIAFDSTGQPPTDLSTIRIVLNIASKNDGGGSSAIGQVAPDGRFTISDVIPGAYRVAVLSGGPWRPKSFDVAGRDAMDFLLDVPADRSVSDAVLTLTSRTATLSGTLQETTGQPTAAYTIIVFAEDSSYWTPQSRRIQSTRPATNGRFSFRNLPAGAYRLVAVEDIEDGQWSDPGFLRQLLGAALPITLGDGETRTQDVRVAR